MGFESVGALVLVVVPVLLAAGGALQYDDVPEDVETFLPNVTATDGGGTTEPQQTLTPSTARKCCPPGLVMYRVNAPGCDNQVTCKITDSPSSILWSLQPGGAAGQYGFPTTCPRERCHLVLLDNGTEPRAEPYCLDKLAETDHSGQVVAMVMAGMACVQGAVFAGGTQMGRLRASSDPSTPGAPLVPFRKCCAVHQRYDLVSRECVDLRDRADAADTDDDSENAVSTTPSWPPPADYDSQQQAVNELFRRVFHKNLSALVDMSVGPPECERPSRLPKDLSGEEKDALYDQTALLDVAVFDVPWDEQLADEHGVLTLRPAGMRGTGAGAPWRLGPGEYCVDDAGSAGTLAVKVCLGKAAATAHQVCQRFGCFRKCCPHHEYFTPAAGGHECVPRPLDARQPPMRPEVHDPPTVNLSDAYAYEPRSAQELVDDAYQRFVVDQRPQQVTYSSVVYNPCPQFRYRLDEDGDVWFFDRAGTMYQPSWPDTITHEYCLDYSQEHANLSVLVCLPEVDPTQADENTRIVLIAVGLLISCMFLALTLLTYCCLPALQNLHGKTLMCHVSSLLIAYLFLACTQMLTMPVFLENEWICTVIGNCVLFTFLSAFSWLNVMCFDIWRTFGGMTSTRTVRRSSASRRFRWYCVYAWGLSSFITAVCITVDQWPGNDKSVFRPQIGDGSCWFRTEPFGQAYGILIFFVGPLLVQTCSNLVLFVLTVMNYSRIKSEINRMHAASNSRKVKKFQADSNKLKMNGKLFVVMGVTWVLELVSTFFPRDNPVFYLSDAANALQGVAIFAIFVLKRKVMRALAVRFGRAPPPPPCSASPSVNADCRLTTGLAVRGKTTSTNTLFTSDFRSTASRVETVH